MTTHVRNAFLVIASCCAFAATAADIGQIKISRGLVTVERGAQSFPGAVGTRLQASDVITTGADGSVGITMNVTTRCCPRVQIARYRSTASHSIRPHIKGSSTRRCAKVRYRSSRAELQSNRPTRWL